MIPPNAPDTRRKVVSINLFADLIRAEMCPKEGSIQFFLLGVILLSDTKYVIIL